MNWRMCLLCAAPLVFWNCPKPAKQALPPQMSTGDSLRLKDSLPQITSSVDSLPGEAKGKIKTKDSTASGVDGNLSREMDSLILDNKYKTQKGDTITVIPQKIYDPAPLVCEANPGTMGGSGKRGVYELSGDVVCWYKELVFKTKRAIWDRNSNKVNCEGGMEVEANGLVLTSERGGYYKGESKIWARQNAIVRDTSGEYNFSADHINYDIESHLLSLNRNAVLRKFFAEEKSKTSKKPEKKPTTDTLMIEANNIEYNDSLKWAIAQKKVKITRGHLVVRCDSAHFQEETEIIDFHKKPLANFKHNKMYGDSMTLKLKGENIEGMSFVGNARGDFFEKEDSLKGNEEYHLAGDSMYMKTAGETLDYLEVVQNAKASFLEKKHPDKINEMEGRYLKLSFEKEKLDSAAIFGAAKTIYFIFEKEIYKGKNIADGDSINLSFDNGKVSEIFISGRARGSFFGEEGN